MKSHLKLISGTANPALAKEIAQILKIKLSPVEIKRFNDGEVYCRIQESVRGADVFVIQPTSPDVNYNLMELLVMVDALKRASPDRITAVLPYMGYMRQDRKVKAREPITAKLVAKLIEQSGVDHIMTLDLHVPQAQGFFDLTSDNFDLIPIYAGFIVKKNITNPVFVSPDVGGVKRTRAVAKVLEAPIAIIDKRRPEHGIAKVENVIGEVTGKNAILIDDMIDTAGTITEAAAILKKHGALDIYVLATHGVLSDPAIDRLEKSEVKEVFVTNTIELAPEKKIKKIKVISVAPLLAEAIIRSHEGRPMGVVYEELYEKIKK